MNKNKKIYLILFFFVLFEEINGTDLIIQFLISANLIEQKTKLKTATENPSMRILFKEFILIKSFI
jgi:hypothetical protein